MIIRILILLVILFFSQISMGQSKKQLRETQRTQFELNNYYLFLNINALLTTYSTKIEFVMDSVMAKESSTDTQNRQLFLKSALITSVSQTAFHPDPLAAAIDSWVMAYQLSDYFDTAACTEEYGGACPAMKTVFREYASRYENGLNEYLDAEDVDGIRSFSAKYPIRDSYLTRRSIIYELSDWISTEQLRLKTGLINMNELMRDLGGKIEYYAAMFPKQTVWEMQRQFGKFIRPDSMALLMRDMRKTLNVTADLLESSEELLSYNRDTLLANVDFQRRLTMSSISKERIAALEAISAEREAVLNSLRQERIEAQQFIAEQREYLSEDMLGMTGSALEQSKGVGKELVDYVFYRMLILTAIVAVFLFAGVWYLKK